MSRRFWRNQLKQFLSNPGIDGRKARIAFLGVGNDLHADDGAGVEVIRALRRLLQPSEYFLLVEGATAPENFSAPLRRFKPDILLFIDAANMGEKPGALAFLEMGEIDGFSASTHILPLTNLASFIKSETGCRVAFLGIQPARLEFDSPMTPVVKKSVYRLSRYLVALLGGPEF